MTPLANFGRQRVLLPLLEGDPLLDDEAPPAEELPAEALPDDALCDEAPPDDDAPPDDEDAPPVDESLAPEEELPFAAEAALDEPESLLSLDAEDAEEPPANDADAALSELEDALEPGPTSPPSGGEAAEQAEMMPPPMTTPRRIHVRIEPSPARHAP